MTKNTIKWIKDFSRKPLLDGKNIIELLKYDDYSLWWFLEWLMEGGRFHFLNISSILQNPKQKNFQNKPALYLKFIRIFIRKIIWYSFIPFNKIKPRGKNVAFVSTLNKMVYNNRKDEFIEDEVFLPLTNILQDKYKDIGIFLIDLPYKEELGFRPYFKGIKRGINFIPLESFMGVREFLRAHKYYTNYKNIWSDIKNSPSLNFLDKDIQRHIINNFDFFFSIFLFIVLWEIEAYKSMFNKYNINLLCTGDPFNLSGFKPRLAFKGKMIGIQPGLWGSPELEYVHSQSDIKTYPLIDYAAVWDKKTKDSMHKLTNIPMKKMIIVGNSREDDIFFKLKHYNLKLDKKKILFLSLPFYDKSEFNFFLDEAFSFLKKVPQEEKIIRPHPNEKDTLIYQKLINEYNLKNTQISKDQDIIFPLSQAKFVVTGNSTVVLESALLKKPTIILDVFNKGYSKFVKSVKSVKNSSGLLKYFYNIKKYDKRIKLKPRAYSNMARLIAKLVE